MEFFLLSSDNYIVTMILVYENKIIKKKFFFRTHRSGEIMYNCLMTQNKFSDWLMDQLRSSNITQSELAKRSGLSTAHITRLLNGERKPGNDALTAVAKGLRLPPSEVFQAAGVFENPLKELNKIQALAYKISMLPPSQQRLIDAIIETMLSQLHEGNIENKED